MSVIVFVKMNRDLENFSKRVTATLKYFSFIWRNISMFIQYFKGNRIVWLSGDLELIYISK